MGAAERAPLAPAAPARPPASFRREWGFAAVGAAALGTAVIAMLAPLVVAAEPLTPLTVAAAGFLAVAVAVLAAWAFVVLRVLAPIARLAAEARFLAENRSEAGLVARDYGGIAGLAEIIARILRDLASVHRDVDRAVASATLGIEDQKRHLEAVLRDLSEGVLVCNLDHHILLYNQVALSLLHVSGELGLGRSLFNLVTRDPILHALDRLLRREPGVGEDATVPLVAATLDSRTLLSGRMSLVLDAAQQPKGYVLTLIDVTREMAELARRDALLRSVTEALRPPLANLRAAAETLWSFPAMEAERRRSFEDVILREGNALSERLEAVDRDYRNLRAGDWPMADIHSVDLFNCVVRALDDRGGPRVTPIGVPLWLHGDSHALAVALEYLLRKISETTGADAFDVEALLGDRRVYIEISWSGQPLPSALLDAWAGAVLPGALGSATLGDVLARHGSEMWSQAQRAGSAFLRLPLPAPVRPPIGTPSRPGLPPRPEFYDFDLLQFGRSHVGDRRPLRSLAYVVFDTETTGLRPSQGDEIVSIGAVRIVNGRLLTGETFHRLVNPRRAIPPDSIRFHGITDAMVADAPPIEVVLPQFRSFAADAVLVAHNAAFDLKFLKLKEAETGAVFDNVPLDVLLISAFLFQDLDDHSLDGIAGRLGIAIAGRHSALGDAMATAAVFLRLLERLEARGIDTLEDLLAASRMTLEIRARQSRF